ncbi:MAG: conjugative transposon protein TraM [Bacteroidota bacterium]
MIQQKTSIHALVRKHKFLLAMPLIILPFLALLLWSVGLIGTTRNEKPKLSKGLNFNLPGAITNNDSSWSKLRYYEEADKDSAKFRSWLNNDPYYSLYNEDNENIRNDSLYDLRSNGYDHTRMRFQYDPSPTQLQMDKDLNEQKVYHQIAKLNVAMNSSKTNKGNEKNKTSGIDGRNHTSLTSNNELDQLQNMMHNMQTSDSSDPELQQINGLLEKILDVQHPERIRQKTSVSEASDSVPNFLVSNNENGNISLLISEKNTSTLNNSLGEKIKMNSFYSLEENPTSAPVQNTITAIIDETQTFSSGSIVKIRIPDDLIINGYTIPKNKYVFGSVNLEGERLNINIKSIRHQSTILPVNLSAYDLDGLEGIFIPGVITKDITSESTDRLAQSMRVSLDPSLSAQAASAGLQAAKSLISKKAKLIRVTIRSGYRLLLNNKNIK